MPDVLARRVRAALLVLIVTFSGCETSSPGNFLVANLALAPRFDAATLARAPIAIDQVRVTVVRNADTEQSEVVVDRVVPFPADDDELTINLQVPLIAQSEELTVTVDLYGGSQRYYTASDVVTVVQSGSSDPATPDLTFRYVGPGANAAAVVITPRDTVLSFGDELTFVATARDAQGRELADVPVTWSTSDPQVAISDDGTIQAPERRATIQVTATLPTGVSDEVDVTFVAVPSSIEVTAGADQTGTPGAQLSSPFVVLVTAADGLPVAGVPVEFTVVSGGGSVGEERVETNGSGLAATSIRLGSSLGTNQYQAEVAGLPPVTITATAAVGSAFRIRYRSGGGQSAPPGTPFADPLVVEVTDAEGFPVPDATVTWSITPGGSGSVSTPSSQTDFLGRATMTPTAGLAAGVTLYNASLAEIAGVIRFPMATVTGPASSIQIFAGGNRGIDLDASAFPMEARVVDVGGNPVPDIDVTWQILGGAPGELDESETETDRFGIARNSYQATTTPNNPVQVRASISSGATVTFSFPVGATAGYMIREQGDGQFTEVGQSLEESFIAVLFLNEGNSFGAPVVWDITSGGGGLTDVDGTTGSFGDFSARYIAATRAGPKVIRARHIASGAFMNFNAMALPGAPAGLLVASGDNQRGQPGSQLELPLQVVVLDQFNNPVPDVQVFWNRVGGLFLGTSTTGPLGFASRPANLGLLPGDQQFQASVSGGLSVTFNARAELTTVKAP